MRAFLLLFLLFPLLELAVMIKVGSAIGVLPTLLLIVLGILVGGLVLRLAGVATAWRARERLARGELPEQEMLDGLLIAIGGGLLLLPGFVSDLLAIPCLLPFTRHLLLDRLRRRTEEQALRRRAFFDDLAARSGQSRPEASSPRSSHPNVIEGEYERRDD
ncbi:FxsA family protein [Azorhizophilus paspali]|uniref:FxsA family protein n=1 Tax=Azorhizophilus paspali TaxID=69963 RepID=A0ABV6STI1_AZOPA